MRAKKSYGQHFLKDERIARRIVEAVYERSGDLPLVEVGPGMGVLTKHLLIDQKEFRAIEADLDMVNYLEDHFPWIDERLIRKDFLKTDISGLYQDTGFILFGNFPYNISSQILIRMLKYRSHIPQLVGMFQREVAERVVAPPGSKTYGRISVMVQAYYEGSVLFGVKPGSFSPPPKVDSAVIALKRKSKTELDCDEKKFKQVVSLAFSQRRKMLRNSLKSMATDNEILRLDVFTKRPEQLSVDEFVELTQIITKTNNHES